MSRGLDVPIDLDEDPDEPDDSWKAIAADYQAECHQLLAVMADQAVVIGRMKQADDALAVVLQKWYEDDRVEFESLLGPVSRWLRERGDIA